MSRVKTAPNHSEHHLSHFHATRNLNHNTDALQDNPIALDAKTASDGVRNLNLLLADSITLRDMYKKHHWQAAGPVFYMIHLLYDKHADEQNTLVDLIAERIQTLGGIAVATAHDVIELTNIPRVPRGRETVSQQIIRLLAAHDTIISEARKMADAADETGDPGTNDLLISNVVRTNELQAWFIDQHLR